MTDKQRRELPEGYRPLSNAPEFSVLVGGGKTVRVDSQQRVLCAAKRRDGELCKSPAVTGLRHCRMHCRTNSAGRRAALLKMDELVRPATATLAKLMTSAESEAVRLRAAENILDRGGVGRGQQVTVEDASGKLYERLLQKREEAEALAAMGEDEFTDG